jgi:hypothetical protein
VVVHDYMNLSVTITHFMLIIYLFIYLKYSISIVITQLKIVDYPLLLIYLLFIYLEWITHYFYINYSLYVDYLLFYLYNHYYIFFRDAEDSWELGS